MCRRDVTRKIQVGKTGEGEQVEEKKNAKRIYLLSILSCASGNWSTSKSNHFSLFFLLFLSENAVVVTLSSS